MDNTGMLGLLEIFGSIKQTSIFIAYGYRPSTALLRRDGWESLSEWLQRDF